MFSDDMSSEEKLTRARALFEETLDFYDEFFTNCKEAFDYHDGHQWSPQDLEILEEDGRPALTFNVVKARVRHTIGAHEDNRKEATLEAVGSEDQFAADILNHILKRLRKKGKCLPCDRRVFKDGTICGKGDSHLDVYPDPDMPTWVKVDYARIDPQEVKWDPAAKELSRSDARYLFWDKWVSRSEFRVDYPEWADDVDEIMEMSDDHGQARFLQTYGRSPRQNDGYIRTTNLKYYDRRRDMVRVIHMEYKQPYCRYYVHNPDSGRVREIDESLVSPVQNMFEEAEIVEVWDERVKWLEFIGNTLLYDGLPEVPYSGWGVDSFYYDIDYNSGLPVGSVWDLLDPQAEVNKRHSEMLDLIHSQTQPGVYAEIDAPEDRRAFEGSLSRRGSVSWLARGGSEKIKDRKVPDFPEAVARLHDTSMKMVEVISGVFTDELTSPRGIPEAAATTQLKDRKAKLTQLDPISSFQEYLERRAHKELEVVVLAMPDDQIAHMLGNSKKYRVEGDVVMDVETGMELTLYEMRDIEFDVELHMTDGNQSQRLLELATLMEMGSAGLPIDPAVLFELTTLRADLKVRLAQYASQTQQQAAEAEGRKSEFLNRQIELRGKADSDRVRVQAAAAAEKMRHNVVTEIMQSTDSKRQHSLGLLGIWEKADEAEKQALLKMADLIEQRQARRELPAQTRS